MIESGVQNLLRAAAARLAGLADGPDTGIDPDWAAHRFAGVDFVGIDFSTSIRSVAEHVIRGWDRYRAQMNALRPDHGVWAFGVNCVPSLLTRRPVPPGQLPSFRHEHFRRQGDGRGLIELGSAFYDYFRVALELAQELTADHVRVPITISLLCDGFPNGGLFRAEDVRPQVEAARSRGVRFKLVVFVRTKYWRRVWQFSESVGISTSEDLEIVAYDGDVPDGGTMDGSFASLSHF
jgi:hypothetical protein